MQTRILEQFPAAALRVYAVWLDMYPGDRPERWDPGLLADGRVLHFWDAERAVGRLMAGEDSYRHGPITWDVYFLYGPAAVWEERPEQPLRGGRTIIDKGTELARMVLTSPALSAA